MSLKSFHIAFITISAALGLFLIVQNFSTLLTSFGILLLVALIPYGFYFLKKMKTLSMITVLAPLLFCERSVWACSVCFGGNSSLVRGAKMGVLFLVLLVGTVLFFIGSIACSWIRRESSLTTTSR
ncbi:MAG: hypothetical protein HYW02_03135 [Deltaproteobacteria bacterium]|nr:hypothetical protein [Deltaproteobacteria bacterium]MBI2500463.1 hypothetical protein [Deltaproteobacteria bacterium]